MVNQLTFPWFELSESLAHTKGSGKAGMLYMWFAYILHIHFELGQCL